MIPPNGLAVYITNEMIDRGKRNRKLPLFMAGKHAGLEAKVLCFWEHLANTKIFQRAQFLPTCINTDFCISAVTSSLIVFFY